RRAHRPRGSCRARVLCGAQNARDRHAICRRGSANSWGTGDDPSRAQFGGDRRLCHRQRSAYGLHSRGPASHLAALTEQMAKPGSVLTPADTLELAEGYVAVKSLGPVPVKGLANPVQIYEVTGAGVARTRLQAAAGRGLTRFVGRNVELEQLRRAQQLAVRSQGQVVVLVGEAGVGKSRLVREFVHSQNAVECLVLESKSAAYSHAMPYLPVIELLRHYFQISVHDSTRSIREKVTDKILT